MKESPAHYDLAVVGSGIVGLFAMYWARSQGAKVIIFDRYHPPHRLGSSHGLSRAIERTFNEVDERYKPWVRQTWELWETINLAFPAVGPLQRTGALIMIPEGDPRASTFQSWAQELRTPVTLLGTGGLRSHFPYFSIPRHTVGLWEKDAALIRVEPLIEAMVAWGESHGVAQHYGEGVQELAPEESGVIVMTPQGRYQASRVIVTPGPWLPQFNLSLPIRKKRQLMIWVPRHSLNIPTAVSVDLGEHPRLAFYPESEVTVKIVADVSLEDSSAEVAPASGVNVEDIVKVNDAVRQFWRGIDQAPLVRHEPCTATYTPDLHFYVGIWPKDPHIIVGGGFSGRGFKYAPLAGRWLVDLAFRGESADSPSLFRLDRYS